MNLKTFVVGRKANQDARKKLDDQKAKAEKARAKRSKDVASEPTGDGSKA